ncbi:MAG: nucleotidyltransferase family protein [Flavobacteriaceae bacterium]|nr:nucleotidyltransferase family protein [Flavobacteriaceae bacterium]
MDSTLKSKIDKIIIDKNDSILLALKKMDKVKKKLLLVFDQDDFYSLVSIGDIQRAIIGNYDLNTKLYKILRKEWTFSYEDEPFEMIKEKMLKFRTECMPVLNRNNQLVDVFFWDDIFGLSEKRKKTNLNLPVIIMAGGKGTRLQPLTNVIPKPLIPIGKKTIIEEIMDRFIDVGCNNFYLSINYKAETIKHYFEQLQNNNYKIDYFQEDLPLGTAGSLFLIKNKIKTTFFVSNCDIIIDEDYSEIYNYHKDNKNELTIVSALMHYPIPYGTVETKENGLLTKLVEKPELTFQINSGMYILEPHLLKEIPDNKFFHITHLIENVRQRKGKVGVFPISKGSWMDIGTWDEYLSYHKFHNK